MKKIYKNLIVMIFLLGIIVSCGKKEEKIEENIRPVKVEVLGQSNLSLGYTAEAEIKGNEEISYMAVVDGTVSNLNVKDGDYVNKGQVILTIDNQAARSNVQIASSNYSSARIQFEKYSTLYQKGLITETEYLNAKTNFDSANSNLAIAQDNNSKTVIRADISGVVSGLKIEKHQRVMAGQEIFKIVNENEMKVEVGVTPGIISKIKIGTDAKIKIDELNKEVSGKVSEISGTANTTTRQFTVTIKIPNTNNDIKSGMYGTVNIDTGVENGIVIPKESIVIRGVEQVVYIVENGVSKTVRVKILNQNDKFAAVEGEGLVSGASLVIDGQNVLQDSEKVRIVK